MGESHTGPGGYKITPISRKKSPTPSGSYRPGGGADPLTGKATAKYKEGGGYYGDGARGTKAFAYDPQAGTYRNENDYYQLQMAGQQPTNPMPTTPGSRGPGGGGPRPDFAAYSAAMMKLLNSSLMQAPKNPLDAMINPAVDADIAAARGAYSGLAGQIPMNDPYLALVGAQAPTVGPEMEQFLQGQGLDTQQYGNAVDYANAQLGAGAQNWSQYAQAQGANHLVAQQRSADTAKLQGEQIVSGLEGQRTSLQAMAAAQNFQAQQAAQQQKLQLILQLMQAGLQYGQQPNLAGVI